MTITATDPTANAPFNVIESGEKTRVDNLLIRFESSKATNNFVFTDIETPSGGDFLQSNFTAVSSTVYTGTFQPKISNTLTEGTYKIIVRENRYTDSTNGIANIDHNDSSFSFTYDTTGPQMSITAKGSTSNTNIPSSTSSSQSIFNLSEDENVTVTFTSNEAISVVETFTQSDITVTNGTLSNFNGSGTTYTASFVPDMSGNSTIAQGQPPENANNDFYMAVYGSDPSGYVTGNANNGTMTITTNQSNAVRFRRGQTVNNTGQAIKLDDKNIYGYETINHPNTVGEFNANTYFVFVKFRYGSGNTDSEFVNVATGTQDFNFEKF